MEEKGWTWRRNRAGQSSSSPQQTPTSLCCCAGAATKQCSSRMWARAGPIVLITLMCSQSKQELPIWRRMGQSGGEERSQKNLIEGEVPTKLVQKCNQLHRSTILIVLWSDSKAVHPLSPSTDPTLFWMPWDSNWGNHYWGGSPGESFPLSVFSLGLQIQSDKIFLQAISCLFLLIVLLLLMSGRVSACKKATS